MIKHAVLCMYRNLINLRELYNNGHGKYIEKLMKRLITNYSILFSHNFRDKLGGGVHKGLNAPSHRILLFFFLKSTKHSKVKNY